MTDQAQATAVQVCQKHGKPDDLVVCPFSRCQVGRVPQWYGNGMPAGTRACTVCDGHGRITRAQAEESRRHLFGDDTWLPFCICHAFVSAALTKPNEMVVTDKMQVHAAAPAELGGRVRSE